MSPSELEKKGTRTREMRLLTSSERNCRDGKGGGGTSGQRDSRRGYPAWEMVAECQEPWGPLEEMAKVD